MLYEEYNEAETMELFKKDGIEEKARKVAINGYRMGLSIETIAEMVEVPVEVVLKWITETEDEPIAA